MKKPSKNKNRILIYLVLIFLILLAILGISVYFSNFNISIPFITRTKISSTDSILMEINKVSSLSTVEYIYKSVFPFDFIEADTDWVDILKKRMRDKPLNSSQKEKLELYDLCKSIGIELLSDTYDFVVITSKVEAGFNFDQFNQEEENIFIDDKSITIKLPDPVITKFIIEDLDSANYPYPDLNVDPVHWKNITDYVEEKIREKVINDGVLLNAKRRGQDFIRSILKESGSENIFFIE